VASDRQDQVIFGKHRFENSYLDPITVLSSFTRHLPRPRWGSLQRSPRPLAGGEGAGCPLPKNPTPRSRAFGPRCSTLRASVLGPSGLDVLAPQLQFL